MENILNNVENNCQVFTPQKTVKEILNMVGYTKQLFGKKVLENSCGDGQFLLEIVRRYIKDSFKNGLSVEEVKSGLESDIVGVELDELQLEKCKENLNSLCKKNGLDSIQWRIIKGDGLKVEIEEKFDFVIGNPPYINYTDLHEDTRAFIKNNFVSCSIGKPDYYYAFIESSLSRLKSGGKLAYLIPNNFYKNQFADKLRKLILPHLVKLFDYTKTQLFEDRMTSSVILICEKDSTKKKFIYNDANTLENKVITKNEIIGKWRFGNFQQNKSDLRFGDYFQVSHSVATQLNEVFVLKNFEIKNNLILFNNEQIELGSTLLAASPKSKAYNNEERIIYPYRSTELGIEGYDSKNFKLSFPKAYKYLSKNKEALEERKKDKKALWFHYGRSQALNHINREKLLMSTIITERVKIWDLLENELPYSGLYIYPIGNLTLDVARKILESSEFLCYIMDIGISSNGNSYRISSRDIISYRFDKKYIE